jgi:hypothetical protein
MTEAEQLALLQRIHARLSAASDADWATIARGLDPLRGEAVAALWRRAQHRSLWIRAVAPSRADPVAHALFAVGELVAEFRPPRDPRQDAARTGARPGSRSAHSQAILDLHALAADRLPHDPLAVDAVFMACALASMGRIHPARLREAWAPLEPVVPLASVRPSRAAA